MTDTPNITMKEAEEAMKNGQIVFFRNPGEPVRILSKEESEICCRQTEEHKKRYAAFMQKLQQLSPMCKQKAPDNP